MASLQQADRNTLPASLSLSKSLPTLLCTVMHGRHSSKPSTSTRSLAPGSKKNTRPCNPGTLQPSSGVHTISSFTPLLGSPPRQASAPWHATSSDARSEERPRKASRECNLGSSCTSPLAVSWLSSRPSTAPWSGSSSSAKAAMTESIPVDMSLFNSKYKDKDMDHIDSRAQMISRCHGLDFYEVRFVLKELQKLPHALPSGGVDVTNFKRFLQRIFEAQHIPDAIGEAAYEACLARDGPPDISEFFLWYKSSMLIRRNCCASGKSRRSMVSKMASRYA
eukprot:TRINITY_DN98844_c0_g1_i1.p1 TRINITY_DN98844_c0_g1~~TRINITY_DN98844_c0_g1_i1.p1  ORF type:complete len:279 (+),score=33.95 TRINITY_DN98844_c0_g1_i1:84-920(+)